MIHVIGIGLDGQDGLTDVTKDLIAQATILVGSDRHLSYFPEHPAQRLILGDLKTTIDQVKKYFTQRNENIIVLVSGDPLFFGLGRFLLAEIPAENLTFHPHVSSVQLAFNKIKTSWQDASIITVHGRSLEQLTKTLKEGKEKIAILTDEQNNPAAIAQLISSLNLPFCYQFWVGENLGGGEEKVQKYDFADIGNIKFATLNVVVLIKDNIHQTIDLEKLPLFGINDDQFLTFTDKPGLMTKREVRLLVLAEMQLQPKQIIWDLGAGTGSVSIEIARLCPNSTIYAIEKTAAGHNLIIENSQRFNVNNIIAIHGKAPEILTELPAPNRIFIGGSGGNLTEILTVCHQQIQPDGVIVIALATLEHLHLATNWLKTHNWSHQILQVNLSKSIAIANLTRFSPLNPVSIITAKKIGELNSCLLKTRN